MCASGCCPRRRNLRRPSRRQPRDVSSRWRFVHPLPPGVQSSSTDRHVGRIDPGLYHLSAPSLLSHVAGIRNSHCGEGNENIYEPDLMVCEIIVKVLSIGINPCKYRKLCINVYSAHFMGHLHTPTPEPTTFFAFGFPPPAAPSATFDIHEHHDDDYKQNKR